MILYYLLRMIETSSIEFYLSNYVLAYARFSTIPIVRLFGKLVFFVVSRYPYLYKHVCGLSDMSIE